jgi:DNA polymerase III epsilon subunit-like protein
MKPYGGDEKILSAIKRKAGGRNMTNSYVAVDLETTGIGAKKEKITDFNKKHMRGSRRPGDRYVSYFNQSPQKNSGRNCKAYGN